MRGPQIPCCPCAILIMSMYFRCIAVFPATDFGIDTGVAMELFLNLCWLSLSLPAYLLWRQRVSSSTLSRPRNSAVSPLAFLCVLGCALVLLFPVISASDDMHAMRAVMEESSPGKRSVSHAAGENASSCPSRLQNLTMAVRSTDSLGLTGEAWQDLLTTWLSLPASPSTKLSSRAPPICRLA